MSHARPAARSARPRRGAGTRSRRVRRSAGCGASRHAGSASTGRRSTSRTRKRKERERAATTIEARNAIDSGTASRSARSTASREPRWRAARRRRAAARRGRRSAACPPRRAALGEQLGRPALQVAEARPRRALHRVDQVVGDVDALERAVQAGAGRGVTDHDVVESRPAASTRARERVKPRTAWPSRTRRGTRPLRRSRTCRSRASASGAASGTCSPG